MWDSSPESQIMRYVQEFWNETPRIRGGETVVDTGKKLLVPERNAGENVS